MFTLNVEYHPIANMTMSVQPFIRNSGSEAHMLCDVSAANPKPLVTFYFNGLPISTIVLCEIRIILVLLVLRLAPKSS